MKTEKILMLGGRASGKSSVLAAVFDQAVSLTAGIDLSLSLDRVSATSLLRKLHMVKVECDREEDLSFEMPGIGDTGATEYTIEVGRRTAEPILNLTFVDTAGGLLANEPGKLQDLLGNCRAAILAIDAVELCAGAGKLPSDPVLCHNLPTYTRQLLEQWMRVRPEMPRLLCVVPIKTETYLRERPGFSTIGPGTELVQRIRKEYAAALASLNADSKWTAVVITPVQTVGNVIFNGYSPSQNGSYPTATWRRITGVETPYQRPTGYAPLDCEQPLRHILNFFLLRYIEANRAQRKPGFWEEFFGGVAEYIGIEQAYREVVGSFLDVFGRDSKLINAVLQFTAGAKTQVPFEILQGEHLIRRQ